MNRLLASKNQPQPTTSLSTVVSPVSFSTDNITTVKKTLIVTEVPSGEEATALHDFRKSCDIACKDVAAE